MATATQDQLQLARDTLIIYFELLHAGDHDIALQLQGGPAEYIEELRRAYPEVDPFDFAGLFKTACERQYRCLQVKKVVSVEQIMEDEYRLVVEFFDENGDTFQLAPCCSPAPAEDQTTSQFEYTVIRINGRLRVLEGPIYVP